MPSLASLSIAGVWYLSLKGVLLVQKGTDVSCQPMSSTRNIIIFGLLTGSAPTPELKEKTRTHNTTNDAFN